MQWKIGVELSGKMELQLVVKEGVGPRLSKKH